MKILVTGANGYIGQGVVKNLLDKGIEVIATDIKSDNIDKRAEILITDLYEIDNPYEYFKKPDILLHLAWRDGFVHNSESHINDLFKHYNFINKMCEQGIKHIAIMGTMHEIGFYEGCIKEDTFCNPKNYYGICKNALRNIVEQISIKNGIIFQWLRGYYIVGNSQYGNSIFSKITESEKNGNEYFPFTTGQNQYDFLDYTDFCEQVARAVVQNKINGIINICSGKPEKLADRVEKFIKENNYKIKLNYGEFPDRIYDSKAVWGDNTKIKKIMEGK